MIRGVGHSFGRPRHYGRMHPPLPVPPHDENQLSHVRFSIDPRMGAILSGIRDSPFASDVGNRIARLVVEADPSPTGPSLAEALRPHLWLLERLGDAGLPLTQAGYLKPVDVKALAKVLPTMDDWTFGVSREVDAHPVAGFRAHLRELGLLRKTKGVLYATKLGKEALRDPEVLWRQLVMGIVPQRSEFEEMAGLLLLLYMATTPDGRVNVQQLIRILTELGWTLPGGALLGQSEIYSVWNPLWDAVGNVGAAVAGRRERVLSPAGTSLVRDALIVVGAGG